MATKKDKKDISAIAGKIRCYLLIIHKIKEEKYVSKEELESFLQDKLQVYDYNIYIGTSSRTIDRNFADIEELFRITIDYSKANNGYYISNEFPDIDFERMLEVFDLLETLTLSDKLKKIVFAEKKQNKGAEYLSLLIEAIKNNIRVEFKYRKFDNTVTKEKRIVEPYALKEFKGRWYLLAVEEGGRLEEWRKIKTWGLDRIENFHLTNNSFRKNINLNIEEEFKNSFGIFSDKDKEVEEVILSFTPMGGKYNESFPLHESQEILIDDDKEFRIKLNVKLTYDFIMELLSQSEKMKVIAPTHLKNKLIEMHKNAIKLLEEVDS